MDFVDRIRELASRLPVQLEHIRTEEATKNALVMPFINALGYNVFNPLEVTPELIADVGTKKGEKVDYAVLKDGKPIMLFECKMCTSDLDQVHASQLYRYFSVTETRIGVLTNGTVYRFFSDLEAPNKMDSKPFLEVDLRSLDEGILAELKKFSKSAFELGTILSSASELKYTREIKRVMAQEIQQPSEEFVRFFGSRVYEGRFTQAVREQFTEIVRRALKEFISERVSDRLKSALANEAESSRSVEEPQLQGASADQGQDARVETTEDELEGYRIVRAIVSEVVAPGRVFLRDQQSYCSVLLDDNNRRPICRLRFNASRKYIGLFDENKTETRVPIESLPQIFQHGPQLKATVLRYFGASGQQGEGEESAAAG
jgi:predicted type IV restriction endonuclease